MRGILLAGGSGTRMYPLTRGTSKQLLPIFDKPLIYYPLSVLMLAGLTDILVITTPDDQPRFEALLGDGSHLGINLAYAVQPKPEGLAQAFVIGKDFIGNDPVALALGDNIFYGERLAHIVQRCAALQNGGQIFGYHVKDPQKYGVVEFEGNKVVGIEEKPDSPKSRYAVPGLYFYDNDVVAIAEQLKPSARGELEITDVNMAYLLEGRLEVELLGRGFAWLDTGSPDNLLMASNYVQAIQERQGIRIACVEEIAYQQGSITLDQLHALGEKMKQNAYGQYLMEIADEARTPI